MKSRSFSSYFIFSIILTVITLLNANPSFSDSQDSFKGIDLLTGKNIEFKLNESKTATVVAFLSVNCPCSRSHEPVLNQLAKEFEGFGIRFVGIHSNSNENFDDARNYFGSTQISFSVIQDNQSVIADQYKAFKTPHVYILSPTGKILFQGGVDDSKIASKATHHYLRDALNEVKSGKVVSRSEVRVLGCEIKRP